jgi:diguanylate cyclase (GGDEF)-like protein
MAIAQDHAGFMWFATETGLNRYDGFAFRHYRHERGNPASLSGDFVRDLDIAPDGTLWIATDDGGVSAWSPVSGTFRGYRSDPGDPASLASDSVRTILADASGAVWVGTRGAGLDRIDPATGRVTHYFHNAEDPGSLSDNDVFALAADGDGLLWVGTRAGLNRLDPETGIFTRFGTGAGEADPLPDERIRSLLFDRAGALWIGTEGAGLLRFDVATGEFDQFTQQRGHAHGLTSNRIDTIFEDDRGRLWIGTDKGLNLRHEGSEDFHVYTADPNDPTSLSGDSIFSVYQDLSGLIWIGTRTGGVNKWNPRSWSFGHFKPGSDDGRTFSDPNVTSFATGPDGAVWVATFGGGINLVSRERNVIRQLRHDPGNAGSLSDDRVMALATDRSGHLWAGTMRGGLNEIGPDGQVLRVFTHDPSDPQSVAANGIMSLAFDDTGALWAGTFGGGVGRLDTATGRFTNYGHDAGDLSTLSHPRATVVVEDQGGVIWVGTDGGGLNYLDEQSGAWMHLHHDAENPQSLSANTVYALHVDFRGRLWAGTRGGLDLVANWMLATNAAAAPLVTPAAGLPQTAIYGIESDFNGFLWLSTSQGLIRYSPETGNVRRYRESHGLQGEEFNFGAAHTGDDGTLYFGGSNGFNAFHPDALERNEIPPPLAVTSVSVMNEPLDTPGPYELLTGIELGYADDVVTLDIAALDFTAPDANRFAYRLEGFDADWIDVGNQRRITYTNLDGGRYTLRVRAANSDGVWNEQGIEIPVAVADPPWRTWWAYLLYAAAITLTVFLAWRHHDQKLRREAQYSRRLEKEVSERTRQLNDRNRALKDANTKLVEASTTDVLTGLRNRRYLFEQVSKDVELVLRHYRDGTETLRPDGNNDLLFLMVDLDNFKPVNDSCGHEAGDRLLVQIRDVLLDACRRSDDIIRWGGDEFLVVARDTNRKHAAHLAERIRNALGSRVFPVGDGQVARITTSIGYASYPFIKDRPELLDWEEVLGVADAAMYEAKQKRNAWVGIEGIDWEGSGDELYRAIKSDPGQLAEDGVIRAFESLDDIGQASA